MMNNHRNNLRDSLVGSRNFPAGSHPHRRGHSLSNGFPKDGDENLDLFSKNRRSLSVASSDESSDVSVKLGRLSLGSVKLARNGIDDLLSSTEGGKHDYDWLLTPPGTLLFPSSDGTELQPISVAPRTSSLARSSSKASRLSVSQSESHHSSRPTRSSSVTRPSISSSQFSTYSSNRSSSILNTSSASVSSYIRPSSPITRSPSTARPSTPSTRQTPSRSSTPSRVRPTPNSSSVDKARPSQSSEKDGTPRVKTMWNMREKLGFFVFVLALLCGSCLGRSAVENNCLNVTSPESVKGLYECSIGNFGVPHYGETLVGRVEYPKANQKACTSFEDVNLSFKLKRGGLPTFLLVDRGDCYFTLKAWNAQNGGASAILVADDKAEPLITMDKAEEENPIAEYLQKIMIPSVLIGMALGDSIKKALSSGEMVNLNLDWTEALPHPDERVEYEFWTDSCRECGPKYDRQIEFVKNFKGVAQILEQKGYTQFTPHYITRFCPEAFVLSKHCKSRCINRGRYCAPDPEQDFSRGYDGKDVVVENLRAACVFKVANETGKPWLWWDYVTEFSIRCPMKDKKYNKDCADQVVRSFGISLKDVDKCVGDPDADVENPVLKVEQDAQIGEGSRGDVTILPTLVINNRQYRGKLDKGAVLKAICAGFEETTEPAICLSSDIETNECLENNGGCWEDKAANVTACKDTFRGRVCECPAVRGVKFVGDGYTHCSASGSLRCEMNNGGCWKGKEEGRTFSACSEEHSEGCKCPAGFKGDGVNSCEVVDECKERTACQCPGCECKNTLGSYECSCGSGLLYMREHDTCISKEASTEGWSFVWFIIVGPAGGVAGYALHKYRTRIYMRRQEEMTSDSELDELV